MKYYRQKVKIHGHDFWYLPEQGSKDPNGPIAPLHHCDDDGNLDIRTAFSSDSYAHVQSDGTVVRYGTKIGEIKDLLHTPLLELKGEK